MYTIHIYVTIGLIKARKLNEIMCVTFVKELQIYANQMSQHTAILDRFLLIADIGSILEHILHFNMSVHFLKSISTLLAY